MSEIKRFAIMGVGGYVAPKHLQAIYDIGHVVIAAMDVNDSVGILDRYFPKCQFFKEFERFERFLTKEKREGRGIDYLTVCTPNYLHDAHCRFGLRMGADVICEKPLVLNPWNLEALIEAETQSDHQIANILQLRHHPEIAKLKSKIDQSQGRHQVILNYITPRGGWYDVSWKGDKTKSGGTTTNIGVHLFDLLLWIYGPLEGVVSLDNLPRTSLGSLRLHKADVQWKLSIDFAELPNGQPSLRQIICDGEEIKLDYGFDGLHKVCYERIVAGELIRPKDLRQLIDLMHQLR